VAGRSEEGNKKHEDKKMVYVITGGGSGIGQALSWKLAEQGFDVFIVGRREGALEKTRSRFPDKITAISADITQEAGREKITASLQSMNVKKIAALVHGAGIVQPIAPLASVSLEEWRLIQATNVEAPLFLTQRLLPQLKGGKVLVISTQIAHVAQPCLGPYCVSKAAVFMLSHCFNLDFQELDIHTTTMTPGIVDTPMFSDILANSSFPEANQQFYREVVNKNIWIKPEVVACFIQWLLCGLNNTTFSSKEWDIYDTQHHEHWVKGFTAPQSPGFA
jgi:benzil reductase ((S)-benzoin forming)